MGMKAALGLKFSKEFFKREVENECVAKAFWWF
jgi:hypothetical protein